MARPLKPVDEKLLEKLCKLHLSDQVISSIVEIHVDTLHRRYAEQMEVWKSKSKGKIAEVLFDEAITKRSPWALKAIAQRHLGYYDRTKVESDVNQNVTGTIDFAVAKDELEKRIEELKKKK